MNSPGSNFTEPCKQDCVFGFCLPGQMQNPQYITENALHSCQLGHSDAKEKATLLSTVLSIRCHQWDLA